MAFFRIKQNENGSPAVSKRTIKICAYTVLISAAVALRISFFNYKTLDYIDFLSHWVQFFRDNGGFAALKYSVGNYNIPYLYFLALFSYIPINDLYLIKILSCCFDFLLAWSCKKLAARCGGNGDIAFFAVLFLPTVVVNGSLWAQCDSSYAALALAGLALALKEDQSPLTPVFSMALFALSFAFKLQAVFILPVCVILLIAKRFRLWHFAVFPVTYILTVLPAVIAGRPFKDAILLYFNQAGSVGSGPNYNAPSLTAISSSVESGSLIAFAFVAMTAILLLAWMMRGKLSNRRILIISLIMVTVIPFLLPHMHDRYFFLADVLSVVLACCTISGIIPALLHQFGSFVCYIAYLLTYYVRVGRVYLTNGLGAECVLIAMLIEILIFIFEKDSCSPQAEVR